MTSAPPSPIAADPAVTGTGLRAVVTGCASGIGAAVVDRLVGDGIEVIGIDVAHTAVRRGLDYRRVDLSDPTSIDDFAESIDEPLLGLYNCAGLSSGAATPLKVMAVNFLGLRHLTDRLVGCIGEGGAVVSVASIAARGWPRVTDVLEELVSTSGFAAGWRWCQVHPDRLTQGGYRLSKQAVVYWTMHATTSLAARGVRINCVSPGVTDTPMLEAATADLGAGKVAEHWTPLNRMATPAEQADALVYLNSERASYVTGANLWVDGGFDAAFNVGHVPGQPDRPIRVESGSRVAGGR
jgi:NAD(P)-dependent dehydrogenase (short-subunit alcohol dehydrogenase family)